LCECGFEEKALLACESFLVRFGADDEVLELALELRRKVGQYGRLQQAGSESVSLCMIVKDEESSLARCLASVKPVVHELVVVDTGSLDHTVAIATAFGAKVSHFHWNGSFSDARNFGLDQAGGAWILVLDADEVLSTQDYSKIRKLVSKSDIRKAYSVLTRNYTTMIHAQGWTANDSSYPMEERADGWQPSWKVRLFPHDSRFRFCGEVHEMVETSLRDNGIELQRAPFVVHHYGLLEQDPVKQIDKKLHYFEIGLQKLAQNPGDLAAICELAVQAGELGRFEVGIDLWDRLLQQHPDYVEALFNKGYCLMELQRYKEALEVSRRALELDPNHKEAAFNYGTCELYVGKPVKALQRLKSLQQRYPEYPPLLAVLTLLYLLSNQPDKAVFTYSRLIELNYAITDYAKSRADILIRLGEETRAQSILDGCAKIEIGVFVIG
jgi:glycosyltransferase involved in cell wall biosynthesis